MAWDSWNDLIDASDRFETTKKNSRPSSISKPTHVVIHITGTDNFEQVKNRFMNESASAHYLVKPDGTLIQFVKDKDRAWHAGIQSYISDLYDEGTTVWKKYLRYFSWATYPSDAKYLKGDLSVATNQSERKLVARSDSGDWEHYSYWARHGSRQIPINYDVDKDPNAYSIGIELLTFGGTNSSAYSDGHYSGLANLIKDLIEKYDIPKDRSHIVGHEDVNPVERWGWDPNSGFDWDRLFGLLEEASATPTQVSDSQSTASFVFPVKLFGDNKVTREAAERFFLHTEKSNTWGGWFPLGANTVWHGGVHLHAPQRSDVFAMAEGEIVAVKLAESDDNAIGHYGSHNFILMRHEITGEKLNRQFSEGEQGRFNDSDKKVFYSLYMHLKNEVLDPGANPKLNEIKWLPRTDGGTTGETHTVPAGETIEALASQWHTTAQKIRAANPELESHVGKNAAGTRSWYYRGDVVKRPAEGVIESGFLNSLKPGDIVKVQGTYLNAGDLLWTSGMYGSLMSSGGLIHWEVFSEENLFPSFTQVEDGDQNWNMDCQAIFGMVDQSWATLPSEWNNADIIEVREFYRTNENAAKLRDYACKFISEWAVDVDRGIEDMKGIRSWIASRDKLEPYQWWSRAAAAGVTLPSNKLTWHYNPIAFVQKLSALANAGPIYDRAYVVNHIPATSSHRPGNAMTPAYLTIHSTGNPNSIADGERNWLTNAQNTGSTGFHIVVDENKAIECIPLSEIAYHAGDGANGTGNQQSIGVEIIESGDREKTLANAIKLAAQLLVDHGLGIEKMKRHKDWSGKHCPRILLSPTENQGQAQQTWEWFKNKVNELI